MAGVFDSSTWPVNLNQLNRPFQIDSITFYVTLCSTQIITARTIHLLKLIVTIGLLHLNINITGKHFYGKLSTNFHHFFSNRKEIHLILFNSFKLLNFLKLYIVRKQRRKWLTTFKGSNIEQVVFIKSIGIFCLNNCLVVRTIHFDSHPSLFCCDNPAGFTFGQINDNHPFEKFLFRISPICIKPIGTSGKYIGTFSLNITE